MADAAARGAQRRTGTRARLVPRRRPLHPDRTAAGLPMGNQTSQFFGNVYLDPLDHFVKEELRIAGYVRYVDDFLLFSDDKQNCTSPVRASNAFWALEAAFAPEKERDLPVSARASGSSVTVSSRPTDCWPKRTSGDFYVAFGECKATSSPGRFGSGHSCPPHELGRPRAACQHISLACQVGESNSVQQGRRPLTRVLRGGYVQQSTNERPLRQPQRQPADEP